MFVYCVVLGVMAAPWRREMARHNAQMKAKAAAGPARYFLPRH